MKKLILFLILGIFMINFTSAIEWDNFKYERDITFDGKQVLGNRLLEKYKPIEIKNLLGLGSILFEGYLSQHDNLCGTDCSSTIEIKMHEEGALVDEIIFEVLEKEDSWIEKQIRNYEIYIKTGETESVVDDYELQCTNTGKIYINGTREKSCLDVKTGSHIEKNPTWRLYNLGEEVSEGIYTIKIVGEKNPYQTIDWIIKTNGEWLRSMAIWEGVPDPLAYWTLNGSTGDVVDSVGSFPGTNNGATRNVNGIIDKAFSFATNDYVNFSENSSLDFNNENFSISFWVNASVINSADTLFSKGKPSGGNWDYTIRVDNPGKILFRTFDGAQRDLTSDLTLSTNTWYHVVVTTDNSADTKIIYINGVENGTQAFGHKYSSNLDLLMGASNDSGSVSLFYNGLIDEVGIWNRVLTPTDVSDLYNSGSGDSYPFVEGTVTLNSPLTISAGLVTFNATALIIGGDTVANMSLWTNETGGWALRNVTTGLSSTSETQTWQRTITEGIIWNVQACDNTGACGYAANNLSLEIDNSFPIITIQSPNGTIGSGAIGSNVTLNVTFTNSNLDICWFDYNGTNTTIDGCKTGVKNSTNFILEGGNFNMTIYANDTVGNLNSTFTSWNYTYFENNRTHNLTSFETADETFTINVEGATSATLFYNGTEYTTTKSGDDYTRTIPMLVGQTGNHTVYWRFDDTQNSFNSYQDVDETVFTICNPTYQTLFLNISFKDEDDSSVINASIPTSTFVYWLGDGTVTKTFTLINNTNNFNYEFCATPNRTLNVNSLIQYKQGSIYPQRIFSQTGASLTNTTTNLTLYLLSVSDGLFVTFQVFGGQSNSLEGVSVSATRIIAGSETTVSQGTTDAAGTVTFWLNPDFLHTFTYIKTGFETVIESLFPTQTLYTITMGGGGVAPTIDNAKGIVITTLPQGSYLDKNTFYDFTYIISSSVLDLDEFGFELFYNNGTSIFSNTDTTSTGGTLDKSFNTTNQSRIEMTYFYVTNNTQINGTTFWIIYDANDFSIYNFLTRVGTYISANIFGVLGDDGGYFAKAMLSIVILILVTGTLSLRYGLASEAAVTGLLFGVIFMLNMFNLIPTPDFLTFINLGDFLVFIIALIGIVTIIKEEGR